MSDQSLTVKISVKSDSTGLQTLSQAATKVARETEAVFKRAASADPFARLARGDEVSKRVAKVSKSLGDIGSGAAMVKDQLRKAFSISSADKQVERSLGLIRDRLTEIKVAAGRMKLDADAAPLLTKLRKVEAESRRIKSATIGLAGAAVGNFSGLAGNGMDIGRNLSMLASGEGFEKLAVKMMTLDASLGLVRASSAGVKNAIGGIANAAAAFSSARAATKLSQEIAGIGNTLGVLTDVGAVAGGSLLNKIRLRHLAGAATGYVAGEAAGLGPWGTGALVAGTTVGAHYAPAAAKWAAKKLGIGAAAKTAAKTAASWTWGGLATGSGAALAALAAGASGLVLHNNAVQNWAGRTFPNSVPNWLPLWNQDMLLGRSGLQFGHGQNDIPGSEARLAATRASLHANRELFQQFGLTHHDIANRETFYATADSERQRRDLQRPFNFQLATSGAEAHALVAGGARERQFGRTLTSFNETMSDTTRPDATRDTFARARAASDRVASLVTTDGPGTAAAQARVTAAEIAQRKAQEESNALHSRARTMRTDLARLQSLEGQKTSLSLELNGERDPARRALLTTQLNAATDPNARSRIARQLSGAQDPIIRAELQARLAHVDRQIQTIDPSLNQDKVRDIEKQSEESARRLVEINQQLASSKQGQRETALALLATDQQRLQSAGKFLTEQARAIGAQQRASAGNFGLMSEDDQERALGIARHLSRGGSLDRSDVDFARGVEPLQGMVSSLGRDQAARNGYLEQIESLARPGDPSRNELRQTNERDGNRFNNLAVQVEQRLQVEGHINADKITEGLRNIVEPAMQQLQRDLQRELTSVLSANALARILAQIHGAANPPAP